MKTIIAENSKPHLQRSRWRESSGRLFRSFSRPWLMLFVLATLASSAQGGGTNRIVGVTACNSTNLTIQLSQFCQGPLVAQCGGLTLTGIYNCTNQTFVAFQPPGLASGTCLLNIWKNGVCLASTNVFITNCVACNCPPGPPGPAGATGATGPQGPPGSKGVTGAAGPIGPMGLPGVVGASGLTGATGPAGPPGTNGLNGTNILVGTAGPAGPAGTNGLNGATGPAGPAGATGETGATGTAGSGSSDYGYIYNLSAQVVPLETAIMFSDNGIGTAGLTHAPGSADIVVINAGDYKVTFSVSGTEPNQFALFLNGVPVAGSDYGSGAGTQQNNGQVIVAIGANDVLTLVNHTSAAAVTLAAAPPIGGTVAAVNASILIQKLN